MTEDSDDIIQTTSVGERLRAAREKKKLSLEDIATQTRIPLRHLENLEAGDWSKLPAPTYTIGFAKSYASAIGLDRTEIGDDLRAEMGGQRFDAGSPEVFEPADPARTMPRWLVLSAIGAIVLLVVVILFSRRARTAVRWDLTMTTISAIVLLSSVIQALADYGASSRYAVTVQALVVLVAMTCAFHLYTGWRTVSGRAATRRESSPAS